MNDLLVLLIVAGVLVLAGFVVGLVFFILFLVKSLGGTTGGWRRLAEVYATANPPTGQITKAGDDPGRGRDLQAVRHVGRGRRGAVRGDLAEDRPDPVDRIQGRGAGHAVLAEGADADGRRSARGHDDGAGGGVPGDAGAVAGGTGVGYIPASCTE